jgi:orotidine-5'-phosphate decarboxylase
MHEPDGERLRDTDPRRPDVAVALDFPGLEEALSLVDRLGMDGALFKVGLELFGRTGPAAVRELRSRGHRVFLDLKLHDIPSTVAGAVRAAGELGVDLLTVHASGGPAMIRAARDAVEGEGPRILAVTVLTSMDRAELAAVRGIDAEPSETVLRLAGLALEAGAHGVVASPAEVEPLRARFGSGPLVVTPGIRLPGDDAHDQKRIAGPGEAVRDGSDVLVVGRSVTGAAEPREALERIRSLMAEAGDRSPVLSGRGAAPESGGPG